MNVKKIAAATAIAFGAFASGSALAATATFTTGGGSPASYTEAGITFTSLYPGGHVHLTGSEIFNHDGGCCTNPIQITAGGTFTLSSLDVTFFSGSGSFVGSNAAVYTVTGTGSINFGSLFAGVSSVMWNSNDTSSFGQMNIDNVTVNAIPEPETYAMLLAGLGLMGFAARRRKQKLAA